MMQHLQEDILEIVETIFEAFLDLPIQRETVETAQAQLGAAVEIRGAFCGDLRFACSENLARQAATAFFGMEAQELPEGSLGDTVGEVANIIGGNLKTLLPAPSQLSPPVATQGPEPGESQTLCRVRFASGGEPASVLLVASDEQAASDAPRPGTTEGPENQE